MKNWMKEFENFKLDRDAKLLETERRSIEFSGGHVVVPPLARKTAVSVAAFFSSVTNWSGVGVASSRCMKDHTWPAER